VNFQLWSFHIRDIGVDGLKDLTFPREQYPTFIRQILRDLNADECFYLATCNRVEFLVSSSQPISKKPHFTKFKPKTFSLKTDIITHLLEVTCSVDSVVFGENQILGQIKAAFTEQQKNKLVANDISRLMNLVLREAKEIRTETQLSRLQTSVSSVAAKLINSAVNKKSKILLVGYGETHKLLHKSLEKKNFKNISVTNRTAAKLNDQQNIKKISWLDFNNANLENYDVISFATSSEKPLLTSDALKKTQCKLIIDLCVPANAEAKLVRASGATYIGLDEIQKTLSKDKKEASLLKKQLRGIILNSAHKVMADLSVHSIHNLITANIQKSLEIHELALSQDLEVLIHNLTFEQKAILANWSEKLIKKINHIHLKTYKEVVNVVQNQNRHAQK
jgi:glutamyl-tRNA reductase